MGMSRTDILWTDASLVEQGVVDGISLDLVAGDTNDFEATVPRGCGIARNSAIIVEGTEYGGIVDDIESTTSERTLKIRGRTWLGVLASRVIKPPAGSDYRVFSGDAHDVIRDVVSSCDLSYIFSVPSSPSGVALSGRFDRYTDAASGLTKALSRAGARLSFSWSGAGVVLSCVSVATVEVDALSIPVTVSDSRPVNHLVLLGSGELSDRLVLDVYAAGDGTVSTEQSLFGSDLMEAVYELSSTDDAGELIEEGRAKLAEMQALSPIEVSLESVSADLHPGDFVTAVDESAGVSATAEVARAVVRVDDGRLAASYDAGSVSYSRPGLGGGGSGSGGGEGGTTDYNALSNKPSIEAVTLVGNKTFSDLGLDSLTNSEIEALLTAAG